jgi:hypothetical protein
MANIMGMEKWFGKMAECMRENGRTAKDMVLEKKNTQMVALMLAVMKMTSSLEMEHY